MLAVMPETREIKLTAGSSVSKVLTEEDIKGIEDVYKNYEGAEYLGIKAVGDELLRRLVKNSKIEYPQYSYIGEVITYPEKERLYPDLMTAVCGSSTLSDSNRNALTYMLENVYQYSGLSVFAIDFSPAADESGLTATEQAKNFVKSIETGSSYDYMWVKEAVCIGYDFSGEDEGYYMTEGTQEALTEEDMKNILTAFHKADGSTEYSAALNGVLAISEAIFDGGSFEYPENSLLGEMLSGESTVITPVIIGIAGGAAAAVVLIAAAVLLMKKRKNK